MKIILHHRHQYHTALNLQKYLEARDPSTATTLVVVEDEKTLATIKSHKDDQDYRLYIIQRYENDYNNPELRKVLDTWTDRFRLSWINPSQYTDPLPW